MGDYPDGYVEAHLPDYPDEPHDCCGPDCPWCNEMQRLKAELTALRDALLKIDGALTFVDAGGSYARCIVNVRAALAEVKHE